MNPRRASLALAAAAGFVVGCRAKPVARADTSRVALRQMPSATSAGDSSLAAVRKACDEVVRSWSTTHRGELRLTADSVMDVWAGATDTADTTPVRGCYVAAEDSTAFATSGSSHAPTGPHVANPYWTDAEQRGWVRLARTMADGPDGSSSAYQRELVRCYVAETWDGGDDADSTYVPGTWYRQETWCWRRRSAVTAADTASE